jgi:hypothetical protein
VPASKARARTRYECQNCGKEWTKQELNEIAARHLPERVSEGEPMPAGECPTCGANCHARDETALRLEDRNSPDDYLLRDGHDTVWVTVGTISVYIRRNAEGVSVDLYPLHVEDGKSIGSTWATWADAAEEA